MLGKVQDLKETCWELLKQKLMLLYGQARGESRKEVCSVEKGLNCSWCSSRGAPHLQVQQWNHRTLLVGKALETIQSRL